MTSTMRALAARGLDTATALDFEYGMVFADSMAFRRANVRLDSVLTAMATSFRQVPGVARVDKVAIWRARIRSAMRSHAAGFMHCHDR